MGNAGPQSLVMQSNSVTNDPLTGVPTSSVQFKTDEHSTLDTQTFPFFTQATLDAMKKFQQEADYFNNADFAKPSSSEDFKNNGQYQNKFHFDNGRMQASATSIRSYFDDLIQYSNPSTATRSNKFEAGKSLGYIAHAIQDFYAHANWAESMVEGVVAPGVILNAGRGEFPTLKPGSNASGLMVMDSVRPGTQSDFGTVVDFALGNKGVQKGEKPGNQTILIPGSFPQTVTVNPDGGYADTDMTVVVQVKDSSGTTNNVHGLITSTLDPKWYALNDNGSTLDPKISVSHGYGKGVNFVLGIETPLPLYDPKASASGLAKDAAPDPANKNQTGYTTAWSGYQKMQNIAKFLASEQMLNEISRAYTLIKTKWGEAGANRFASLWTSNVGGKTLNMEHPTFTPDQTTGSINIDLSLRKLNPFASTDPTRIQGWGIIDSSGNTRTLNAVATSDTTIKGYTRKDRIATYTVPDRQAKLYELRDGDQVVATARLPVSYNYEEKVLYNSSSIPTSTTQTDSSFVLTPSNLSNLALDADPGKPGLQATFNMRLESDPAQMLGFTRDDLTYNNLFYGLRNVGFVVG